MTTVAIHTTDELTPGTRTAVRGLLEQAFGPDLTEDDWQHALGGVHVLAREGDTVVAHAAVVDRVLHVGERPWRTGYVEAVATAPERQATGLGTRVMIAAAAVIAGRHQLGALATGVHGFYERLGWERWQGRTFVRRNGDRVPTPGDDDAVMVLRFGLSRGLDLTAPLICEDRAGDVW